MKITVNGMECEVERLPKSSWPFGGPTLEVFAPDGYHFGGRLHSLICIDAKDARERAVTEGLEPCDAECDE